MLDSLFDPTDCLPLYFAICFHLFYFVSLYPFLGCSLFLFCNHSLALTSQLKHIKHLYAPPHTAEGLA